MRIHVYFGFDKLPEAVTSPHPFVDAGGVHLIGDLVKSRCVLLSDRLYKLQELGYSLQLDGLVAVVAMHPDKTAEAAARDLDEVGVSLSECAIEGGK